MPQDGRASYTMAWEVIACQPCTPISRMIHMCQREHHACQALLCSGMHRTSLSDADIQQFVPFCNIFMP